MDLNNLKEHKYSSFQELEQERHHLKRELTDREQNYDSRMQDLQEEVSKLVGQLNQVQKTSRTFEKSHRSNYDDLSIQNDSLHKELDEVGDQLIKHIWYNVLEVLHDLVFSIVYVFSEVSSQGSNNVACTFSIKILLCLILPDLTTVTVFVAMEKLDILVENAYKV